MISRPTAHLSKVSTWAFGLGLAIGQPALADTISAGNPALAPLKWEGLYLFREPDGVYHCTAQFITQRVILMAAHYLRDVNTGKFWDPEYKQSVFFLRYQNQQYSKVYHPICATTWDQYVVPLREGEDITKPETMSEQRQNEYRAAYENHWQYDYGLVVLDGDSLTGHYNYRVNAIADYATSAGYPSEMMSGEVIQYVEGDVLKGSNVYTMRGRPDVQALWHGNSGFTGGSSGGAWVLNFSQEVSASTNIIVGLNSYIYTTRPGAIFSPIFTDSFDRMLKFAESGCKG